MSETGSERPRREIPWPSQLSVCLRTWPYPVPLAVLAALYVGTAAFGLWIHAVGGFATAVWPPTGLALVALVLGGMRLWPGIALGAFVVNTWAGAPWLVAAGMALGNTLEAVLGALLLARVVRFHPALDRLRDVVGFLAVAVLSTLVSATVGVTSGWLGGAIPTATAFEAWQTWWLGDLNGDLVAAALLFTWSTRSRPPLASRPLLEGGCLLLAIIAMGLLVFGRPIGLDLVDFSYLCFPVLIWAALRFGPPGASAATALVSVLAIWGTAHGRGPFVGPAFHESVWALQAFMSIVAATMLVLAAVVAERAHAEVARAASEAQLRLVTDSAPVFLAHCDAEGRYRFVNRGYAERLGLSRDDIVGRRIPEVLGQAAYASFRDYVEQVLSGEPVEFEVEVPYQAIGTRWMHCAYVPERDGTGAVRGHIAAVTDVTARKRMEAQLEASLREKEVLLQEIHHRVKNNFQVIASFLSLQAGFIEAPQLHAVFEECQNRIYSMALVHQNLYQAENLASIDFGAYLESLGTYLLRSYGVDPQRIRFTSTAEHGCLSVDSAIPCGLLVNELVSNALRHAFPEGRAGHLRVTLRREADGQLRLTVRDDGVGLPEGVDFQTTSSFGMRLIALLAQQLHATMTLERHPGTSVTLTFVEPTYQAGG